MASYGSPNDEEIGRKFSMKKNLANRQRSALARRNKEFHHWEKVRNPHPVTTPGCVENHKAFEVWRSLKIKRAQTDIANLEAKLS